MSAGSQASVAGQSVRDSVVQVLKTKEGSQLIGHVLRETPDSLQFATSGGVLSFARGNVVSLVSVSPRSIHNGQYWPDDPNTTRLFFTATGRMLKPTEGYFDDTWIFLVGANHGVTDRLSLGGGMTIIPGIDITDNLFYFTPKLGVYQSPTLNVAVGALAGFAGHWTGSAGIVYGVSTWGTPDASVTAGGGWLYATGNSTPSTPLLVGGGNVRISKRAALVTENYVWTGDTDHAFTMYGFRFFGEKMSVDLAFMNVLGNGSRFLFPGIPWVGFTTKF
jgi:hypothetical protein